MGLEAREFVGLTTSQTLNYSEPSISNPKAKTKFLAPAQTRQINCTCSARWAGEDVERPPYTEPKATVAVAPYRILGGSEDLLSK